MDAAAFICPQVATGFDEMTLGAVAVASCSSRALAPCLNHFACRWSITRAAMRGKSGGALDEQCRWRRSLVPLFNGLIDYCPSRCTVPGWGLRPRVRRLRRVARPRAGLAKWTRLPSCDMAFRPPQLQSHFWGATIAKVVLIDTAMTVLL